MEDAGQLEEDIQDGTESQLPPGLQSLDVDSEKSNSTSDDSSKIDRSR